MSNYPKLCLIDTNIPVNANLSKNPTKIPEDLTLCVMECIKAIDHIVNNKGELVIDSGDEIYDEYRHNLSMSGQPGVGDKFMKWVHDNRWSFPETNRVSITKNGNSFNEFPDHEGLTEFDLSDRKFIAVANAHLCNPVVLQGTDSKWWGWNDALTKAGIKIQFLCPEYVKSKYLEKIGNG